MCKNLDHFLAKLVSLKATRLLKLNEVVTPLNKAKCVDDVTIWPFNVFSRNVNHITLCDREEQKRNQTKLQLVRIENENNPQKKKFPFIFAA